MILTIDCEGTNYDDYLEGSVKCMSRFLDVVLAKDTKVVLFITGVFTEEFVKQGLYNKYKDRVDFGLHIHPENLPKKVKTLLNFDTEKEFIADYSKEEKFHLVTKSYDYLKELGIEDIKYFRGGQFSCDTDILNFVDNYCKDIHYDSHNIYRDEYKVNKGVCEEMYTGRLKPLNVSSHKDTRYVCLENMDYETLVEECNHFGFENTVMLTHSYMFRDDAFRYKRDNIAEHTIVKIKRLLDTFVRYS